ncbi:hypothetical protein [Streptomyces olivoreticuli]|uniref:hypothetical protein n=1 Tax=Streptomyces olivoreticuli TaxID=68246 RepID=UPI0013C32B25|nr:hypothetical protein [Streptomyces olivoreticuli]
MSTPTRMERRSTLVTAVVGAVCAIAAAYLLLVTVPGARAEQRAFKTAHSCRADAVSKKCLRPVAATVNGTETVTSGASAQRWLSVTEDDGTRHRILMAGRPSVVGKVKPGDRVTVTHWHHKSRFVDFHNLRQRTDDDPRGGYRLPYAIALGLLPVAAGFLWAAYRFGRRSTDSPRRSPLQIAVPSAAALLVGVLGAATPWFVHSVWTPLLITGAGTAALLAWAVLTARRDRSRQDDTAAATARVPAGEEVLAPGP